MPGNGKGARHRRPTVNQLILEASVPRHFVIRALDALDIGANSEATEILLAALEHIPAADLRLRCRFCPARFVWPGEREGHEIRFHIFELAEIAEVVERAA